MKNRSHFIVFLFLAIIGCTDSTKPNNAEVITDTTNLKTAIKHKKTITHLDLSNQGLTEFPKEISEMKQLIFLDISGNHISKIEGNFEALDKLLYIDLSENDLTDVPASFASFKKLDHLHLENNKIQVVRTNLAEFPALLDIYLSSNPLIEFPSSLLNSKSIELIDCFETFIRTIPEAILATKTIKTLWLPNKLDPRSNEILDSLILTQDMNIHRRSELGMIYSDKSYNKKEGAKDPGYFQLECSEFDQLEQNLRKEIDLEFLKLSNCNLQEIPDFLLDFPKLKYLDLSGNNISTVDIALLPKNLILLDLSGNGISKEFKASNFPELEYLFLEKNTLSSIDLKQVPKLKIADFSMNPNLKNIKISAGNLKILGLPNAYEEKAISAESLFYR